MEAYVSKVSECDIVQDDSTSVPDFMQQMVAPSGDPNIRSNLTSDVSELEFPSDIAEGRMCGNLRIIFIVKEDARNSQKVYGTKSLQINVTCLSNDNLEDTSLNAVYGSEDIPEVEVGDENPFGVESEVIVNYGSCHSPKTMACMYCGFDDGMVGVDEDSWNMWQTIEVIDLIY